MRTTKFKGVYQRCPETCTVERCKKHKYSYSIQLGTHPNGKVRQATESGFETAKKARQKREEVRQQYRNGTLSSDPKLTVGEYLDTWWTHKFGKGSTNRTAKSYRQHIDDYLIPRLGTEVLCELRVSHITAMFRKIDSDRKKAREAAFKEQEKEDHRWHEARKKRKNAKRHIVPVPRVLSAETKRRIRATLSSALADAMTEEELVSRNVAKAVKLGPGVQYKVKPWTAEVFGSFLDTVTDNRLTPLFTLAGYGGLRRGELCGLLWSDIDWSQEILTVSQQAQEVSGGGIAYVPAKTEAGRDRVVYLTPPILTMLQGLQKRQQIEAKSWGEAYQNTGLVFTREDGAGWHPDYVTHAFPKIATSAGFPRCRLHDLRHFYGSTGLAAGVSMELVSKMIGHSTLAITVDLYSHLPTSAGRKAAATIAQTIPRAAAAANEPATAGTGKLVDECARLLRQAGYEVSPKAVADLIATAAAGGTSAVA